MPPRGRKDHLGTRSLDKTNEPSEQVLVHATPGLLAERDLAVQNTVDVQKYYRHEVGARWNVEWCLSIKRN